MRQQHLGMCRSAAPALAGAACLPTELAAVVFCRPPTVPCATHPSSPLTRHVADDAHCQARPRERVPRDELLRHAQQPPQRAHLVLRRCRW